MLIVIRPDETVISPEDEEWLKRYEERKNAEIRWETYNLKTTFQLIELFGRHSPDQKVLIRPHPAEKLDTYVRLSRKYSNVSVADNKESQVVQSSSGVEEIIIRDPDRERRIGTKAFSDFVNGKCQINYRTRGVC